MIPIAPHHQKFLSFKWVFHFTCLLFSLSSAPRTFTKVTGPVASYLWGRGVKMVIYLDDMLFLHQEKERLVGIRNMVLDLLENLGFLVNYRKSELHPVQEIQFLGFKIDSLSMEISLPSETVLSTVQEAQNLLQKNQVSGIPAVLSAPLHYRGLQSLKHQALRAGNYNSIVPMSREARDDLDYSSSEDERAAPSERPALSGDHNRCFPPGLGSTLSGWQHKGPLDGSRETPTHKLPRAPRSYPRNQGLLSREERDGDPSENGQFDSNSLHKSPGRNEVIDPVFNSNRPLVMVPGPQAIPTSVSCPRGTEHSSRPPIQVSSRQTRLDVEQVCVQEAGHCGVHW